MMTEQEAFETVLEIVRPFVRNHEKFKTADASTRIWEDLQVNSSRFIDILLAIEETFDLEIAFEKFEGASTVGDVAKLLMGFTRDRDPLVIQAAREKLKHVTKSQLAP